MLRLSLMLGLLGACRFEPGALPNTDARAGDASMGTSDSLISGDAMADANLPPTSFLIEAESPSFTTSLDGVHNWTIGTALSGFSGTGYVTALPNTGAACDVANLFCGAASTYNFNVTVAGTYRVTIRHRSDSACCDSVFWGIGFTVVTDDLDPDVSTVWVDDSSPQTIALDPGTKTITLRIREPGTRVDSIRIDLL